MSSEETEFIGDGGKSGKKGKGGAKKDERNARSMLKRGGAQLCAGGKGSDCGGCRARIVKRKGDQHLASKRGRIVGVKVLGNTRLVERSAILRGERKEIEREPRIPSKVLK